MSSKKGGAKKVDQKKVQKIVEDKTFGMKNKNKSKKVQQYIANVKNQTQQSLAGGKKPKPGEEVKTKKQLAAEKAAELQAMGFKPVVDKKVQAQVQAGVDPKSVVCQFFKAGTCTKGNRCKFSHDLSKERKAAKIDLYTDRRDEEGGDTMENWDENKLRDVVNKKHGSSNRTDIICKYFLDAIEQKKYGWFWTCPNGNDKCMYRHALPPGFVLAAKKKKEDEEEEEDKVPLEDLLEQERRNLKTATPLTLELFLKWKEDKRLAKEKAALERKEKIKAGKAIMSGREAFEFNPDLVAGDDDLAYDEEELRKNKEETEKQEEVVPTDEHPVPIESEDNPDEKPQGEGEPAVEVDESVFAADVEEELPEFDE